MLLAVLYAVSVLMVVTSELKSVTKFASCAETLVGSGVTLRLTGLLLALTRLTVTPLITLVSWFLFEVIKQRLGAAGPAVKDGGILRVDEIAESEIGRAAVDDDAAGLAGIDGGERQAIRAIHSIRR